MAFKKMLPYKQLVVLHILIWPKFKEYNELIELLKAEEERSKETSPIVLS